MVNPLEYIDPFFFASLFLSLIAIFVFYFPRLRKSAQLNLGCCKISIIGRVRTNLLRVIMGLLLFTVVMTVVFETYLHTFQCRVSNSYYQHNLQTSHKVIAALKEIDAPIFADFATLLGVIRGQEINIWDHDTDFSMVYPGPEGIQYITDVLSAPELGLEVTWLAPRHLMQLSPKGVRKGPHTDIFFWTDTTDPKTGMRVLESPDHISIDHPTRPYYEIFPLQEANWAGVPVLIPFDTHAVCAKEFGHFGGSYMEAQVFRRDCLHNIFNLRWLPF